jgi:hypothetical protein
MPAEFMADIREHLLRKRIWVVAIVVLAAISYPLVNNALALNPWETIDEGFRGCEGG